MGNTNSIKPTISIDKNNDGEKPTQAPTTPVPAPSAYSTSDMLITKHRERMRLEKEEKEKKEKQYIADKHKRVSKMKQELEDKWVYTTKFPLVYKCAWNGGEEMKELLELLKPSVYSTSEMLKNENYKDKKIAYIEYGNTYSHRITILGPYSDTTNYTYAWDITVWPIYMPNEDIKYYYNKDKDSKFELVIPTKIPATDNSIDSLTKPEVLIARYKENVRLEKKEKEEKERQYIADKENRITKIKQKLEDKWENVKELPLKVYNESKWIDGEREVIEFLEFIKNEEHNDKKIVYIENIFDDKDKVIDNVLTILGPNSNTKNYNCLCGFTVWPIDMEYEDIKYYYNRNLTKYLFK